MKIFQIGLGSMGKRRIRNLQYLGYRHIIGFDKRGDRRKEAEDFYGIGTVKAIDDVHIDDITHVIISTPPDQHAPYIIWALKNKKHVFVEASVVDDGYKEILDLYKKTHVVLAPSCTMRFDPLNIKVKEILDSGKLGKSIFLQHHFGLYLPYWHPYENIKDFYVSSKKTGAAREIVPFDLVYITWFVGEPKDRISAIISKNDVFDADIDDIYSLQFKTERGCHVQLTIDIVSKVPYRTTRIICENGSIEIDTVRGEVSIYYADKDMWKRYNRNKLATTKSSEEMYILEIKRFIEASMNKKKWPYSIEQDWKILRYLYSAEENFKKDYLK